MRRVVADPGARGDRLVEWLADLGQVIDSDLEELRVHPRDAELREALALRARYAAALCALLGEASGEPRPEPPRPARAERAGRPRPRSRRGALDVDLHRRPG